MWYFAWVLGVGLACSFGVLNALWFELNEKDNIKNSHNGGLVE
jgi:cyd operon protein YbgT